jgi:endonuclease/exonuclease/phosphatase family metal-dependent hydrolase
MQNMRWLIGLLLTAQVASAEQVTIVTWNMKWFPGGDKTSTPAERIVHMSAAKDALMDVSPDIICAQEIRNWDVFAELASIRPDLVPNVVSDYRDSPEGGALSIQQIGIASRLPAIGAWSEAFRLAEDSPPRGFSFIALQLDDGRRLLVYSVHLKSNRGDLPENMARREEAAEQIVAHAAKMEAAYQPVAAIVICGDFNTDPSDEKFKEEKTFRIFEDAGFKWPWSGTPLAKRVTLPADGRFSDACFDGFVVKGDMRVVSCEVLPIDGVSDHRPVSLVLE